MADEGNEDSWLYGNEQAQAHFGNVDEKDQSHEGLLQNESLDGMQNDSKINELSNAELDNHPDFEDAGEEEPAHGENANADSNDAESSDDDDDINVVIGDIKSGPSYNIKQRQQVPGMAAQAQDKPKHLGGKFNIEEFESVGTINGTPAHEFNIESIEDKPWRKPGADITDYFNYGFNEETWRAYCERQKKIRVHESGVGLSGLSVSTANPIHDNKYPGIRIGINRPNQMAGGIRKPGAIDVIGGGGGMMNRRDGELGPPMLRPPAPKENIIQVMTADRREYSRTVVGNKFDIPPPAFVAPEEFYHHENDAFNYGYEPTQDSQWGPENPGWQPSDIKELTPGLQPPPQQVPPVMGGMPMMPGMPHPGMRMPPPMAIPQMNPGMHNRNMMHPMDKDRESRDDRRDRDKNDDDRRRYDRDRRERERERSPSKDRRERDRIDRERERRERERERTSSRRERSRSRERSSRRERSRSKDRERSSRRETSKERTSSSSSSTRSKDKKKSHKKDKDEASE